MCCKSAEGFTLIEVMVALLLMSIMALMSWRALDAMVRSRETLVHHGEQFDGMRTLFAQWDADCRAMPPPDRSVVALPLNLGEQRVDLVRERVDGFGLHHAVLVSYQWLDGRVVRLESPPIDDRNQLRAAWNGLLQGASVASYFPGIRPVILIADAQGLGGHAFVDGFDWTDDDAQMAQRVSPANLARNVGLTGAELWVLPRQGTVPLRKTCLTGLD